MLLFLKIGLIGFFFFIMFLFIFGVFRVADRGMESSFKDGDLVVYYQLDKNFISGDTVVIKKDKKMQTKRVVAVGGDKVDITDQGLMVNGSPQVGLEQEYVRGDTLLYKDGVTFPMTLKADEVFLMNDNREEPNDGRMFGATKKTDIVGKTMLIIRRRNF